ncbi:MAG: hypothetical protein WC272_04460 [Sulfurimonas sp.]
MNYDFSTSASRENITLQIDIFLNCFIKEQYYAELKDIILKKVGGVKVV